MSKHSPFSSFAAIALAAFLPGVLSAQIRGNVFDSRIPTADAAPMARAMSGVRAVPGTGPSAIQAFIGPTYAVGPTITPTTTLREAEEHIAVDPNNSNNLVAAISDFSLRGGFNTTKFAVSTDNGVTWRDRFVPILSSTRFPITSDGTAWEANSDPVVAIDKLGNVYLSNLYFNGSNLANGVYVSVANLSSGVNFSAARTYPVATHLDPATPLSEDKEWIATDNTNSGNSGNVYVSWTRFIQDAAGNLLSDFIVLSRSTDQGKTWSPPVRISQPGFDGFVQGSQVAVGPRGEVYVAFELCCFFNSDVFTTPAPMTPLFNDISAFFTPPYRVNSFPALAVSPATGTVMAAYSDHWVCT